MATLADIQRQSFNDRISRIRQGGPNTSGQIFVGPADDTVRGTSQRAKAPGKSIRKAARGGLSNIVIVPFAMALGAAAVFTGRVAAFHFFSDEGLYAIEAGGISASMYADVAIATVVALILAWTFQLTHGMRRAALLAGVVAMMSGELVLMQAYPEVFAKFFSETHVAETLSRSSATL